jgi:23S rRNA (uracil1939-C5)-methyltransferase
MYSKRSALQAVPVSNHISSAAISVRPDAERTVRSSAMQVKIEKLIYGGEGLGHEGGATVFVPGVLPGEMVVAEPVETKKKFVRASLTQVVEASPDRVAPPCPYFGACGGCSYQHLPYELQVKYKTEILRETLRRLGRIQWDEEIPAHASPPWGYRNRAQWKVRALEKPAPGEANDTKRPFAIGYYRANSTALVPVQECAILSPLLVKTLTTLSVALAAGELPRELREIEAFADSDDARLLLMATFAGFPSRADEYAAKFRALIPEMASLLFHDPGRDRMELDGSGFVECAAGGEKYRVGHFSFFQVNRFLTDELVRAVTDGESGKLACDLFAGVGLFALPLTRGFERVIAVEANPAAVRDLEANIGVSRPIEVRPWETERAIDRMKEKPDLIVMDPPRAGLAPGTAARIARLRAGRITYVSCEPPTLARDLADFANAGYEVASVELFDLFPQTFHLETVVKLRRKP